MDFNSFLFLAVFLPAVLIIYRLLKRKGYRKAAMWFLSASSVAFLGMANPLGAVPFILSLLLNYLFAYLILSGRKPRLYTAAAVVFNVLLLSFFKYGPLIIPQIQMHLKAPGVSFYTFCEIAFVVECYRGTTKLLRPEEYAFIMSFFPKLMQGPITQPAELTSQGFGKEKLSWEEIYRGILLFTLGLFKKVIIADTLGGAVDYGFTNLDVLHSGEALVVMLSYTLQLYFDFSGYCDMAMALASFFGYELPVNFNSPYKAKNIDEFWKRWHISLTAFFTRYIYIPLGGNRKGKIRKYINYLLIFLISGLWHGAGWQFIIWGMMHGILFVLTRIIRDAKRKPVSENKLFSAVRVFLTFLYVNVAWVFFRAPSVGDAFHLFSDMAQCWFPRFNTGLAKCFNIDEFWYVLKLLHLDGGTYSLYYLMAIILIGLLILVFFAPNAAEWASRVRISVFTTLLICVLLVWCILSFEGVATYIYVNF